MVRLKSSDGELCDNDSRGLHVICVVGRGHWFRGGDEWINRVHQGEHGEVLGLLGAPFDTLPDFAKTRARPDYRSYFSGVSGREDR
jgi:hypothetical protein